MVRVDSKALVTVRQSRYSVPVALAGLRSACASGSRPLRARRTDDSHVGFAVLLGADGNVRHRSVAERK